MIEQKTTTTIQRCRPREGLQAALMLELDVHCTMCNGIAFSYHDSKELIQWQEDYMFICGSNNRQWKEQEWLQRGYTLILQKSRKYKRTRLVPKRIQSVLTLS